MEEQNQTEIRISVRGLDYLMDIYTNNYSDSIFSYKNNINGLTKSRNETYFNPLHVVAMFYNNWQLNYIEKTYFTKDQIQGRNSEIS